MATRVTLDHAPPRQAALPLAVAIYTVTGAAIAVVVVAGIIGAVLLVGAIVWSLAGWLVPQLAPQAILAGREVPSLLPVFALAAIAGAATGLYGLAIHRRWRASHNRRTMREMDVALAAAAHKSGRGWRWWPRLAPALRAGGAALMQVVLTWGAPVGFLILLAFALAFALVARDGPLQFGLPVPWGGILVLLVIAAGLWGSVRLARMLEQRYSPRLDAARLKTAREERRADRRPPIVYLRSFKDDLAAIAQSGATDGPDARVERMEDIIAASARRLGPVLAIGEPGRLAISGAARGYFSDDEWQPAIIDWVDSAQFVLIVAGFTQGVSWELDTVLARGHAGKCIVVFPPDERNFAARWQWLQERTRQSRIAGLPEKPLPGTLVACLDRFGEILLLTCARPDTRAFRAALTVAMCEVLRA